jgi:hypothetical protein
VNKVSAHAEMTWMRLCLTVDDFGRCEARLSVLRPKLFPLRLETVREADLQRWLAECEKAGLIRFYTGDGKQYLQVMRWERGRAQSSRCPEPPPDIAKTAFLFTHADKCLHAPTDALGSGSGSGSDTDPDSGKGCVSATVRAINARTELQRVEKRINEIRSSVDSHNDLAPKALSELRTLKARAEVLKKELGFSV